MLSDTNAACFIPVFDKRKASPPDQRGIQKNTTIHARTHAHLMTDLRLSEPDDYKILFLCNSIAHHLTGHTKLLTLQSLNQY